MKHILRIDELVSIEGEAPLDADYQILWSNGKLIINPDYKKIFTNSDFLFPVAINVDQKHKLLTMRPMDDWADLKIIKKIQQKPKIEPASTKSLDLLMATRRKELEEKSGKKGE